MKSAVLKVGSNSKYFQNICEATISSELLKNYEAREQCASCIASTTKTEANVNLSYTRNVTFYLKSAKYISHTIKNV